MKFVYIILVFRSLIPTTELDYNMRENKLRNLKFAVFSVHSGKEKVVTQASVE